MMLIRSCGVIVSDSLSRHALLDDPLHAARRPISELVLRAARRPSARGGCRGGRCRRGCRSSVEEVQVVGDRGDDVGGRDVQAVLEGVVADDPDVGDFAVGLRP
ncbi:MAG: hypothetical protein MZU97_20830 [Bacillus subtilis]|nr:hypothetical protein [Bacillus subtilis]